MFARGRRSATIDDVTATRAVLAVQGPEARALLAPVAARRGATVARFAVAAARRSAARRGWVAGTGYTGEDGVELHVPAQPRRAVLAARCSTRASRPPGSAHATRCGSKRGCRCTATSSGPASPRSRPGLGWVVRFDKGDFRGRAAAGGRAGPRRRPPAPRPRASTGARSRGRDTRCSRGGDVGRQVTSGNFSPMLERGIALAFVPPDVAPTATSSPSTCGAASRAPTVVEAAVRPPVASGHERGRATRTCGRVRRRATSGPRPTEIATMLDRARASGRSRSWSTGPCPRPSATATPLDLPARAHRGRDAGLAARARRPQRGAARR